MRSMSMVADGSRGSGWLALALLAAAWLALAPSAGAGVYHVYSCRTPAGAVAPTSGWSGSIDGPWMYDTDSCASGGSLTAALDGTVEHGANVSDAAWTFNAPGGKQLVLEARSGREWLQFDTVSTGAKGRYHATYRFKFPGPITYQFRVLSRYEADFPFLDGVSNVVDVHEH
jgi:hypothetical protein